MPKRADAIAQRLVLIACPGRIAIRLDQLQDLDAYRPFGGRPLHGRIIGIVHRWSRADNVLLEEGELQSVHVDEQRFVGDVVFAMRGIFAHVERIVETRSEEHTSELQSLMRISYAVFCLKKKNHHTYLHSILILPYTDTTTSDMHIDSKT